MKSQATRNADIIKRQQAKQQRREFVMGAILFIGMAGVIAVSVSGLMGWI